MKKLIPCILPILILLLVTCNKNDDGNEKLILGSDYLPLETGNYWQFENSGKLEVTGTKTINNKTYFVLSTQNDTSYYRNENEKIFVIEDNENEALKFDLSAGVNETWNYGPYVVKLISKVDTIEINNKEILNCYQFYLDVPEWMDEEHTIWLAPGIGFIQNYCGLCFKQTTHLTRARIGEKEINF